MCALRGLDHAAHRHAFRVMARRCPARGCAGRAGSALRGSRERRRRRAVRAVSPIPRAMRYWSVAPCDHRSQMHDVPGQRHRRARPRSGRCAGRSRRARDDALSGTRRRCSTISREQGRRRDRLRACIADRTGAMRLATRGAWPGAGAVPSTRWACGVSKRTSTRAYRSCRLVERTARARRQLRERWHVAARPATAWLRLRRGSGPVTKRRAEAVQPRCLSQARRCRRLEPRIRPCRHPAFAGMR